MLRKISSLILKISGWTTIMEPHLEYQRCVLLMAPHTSNWDFVIGRLALWSIGLKTNFLIKKEVFFFPLGPLLKAMGGVPVDRSQSNNVVRDIALKLNNAEQMIIVITPEGTRSLRKEWKKGFYYIASIAEVPILLGYLDYAKKVAGITAMLYPTDNYKSDLAKIYDFYKDFTALYPEKFNLSPMYRKEV
ncbi:MAG: acyltransferase [Bacteroidales bacterium]|nr:acyltransferase [Bacteroidales bacterium]